MSTMDLRRRIAAMARAAAEVWCDDHPRATHPPSDREIARAWGVDRRGAHPMPDEEANYNLYRDTLRDEARRLLDAEDLVGRHKFLRLFSTYEEAMAAEKAQNQATLAMGSDLGQAVTDVTRGGKPTRRYWRGVHQA